MATGRDWVLKEDACEDGAAIELKEDALDYPLQGSRFVLVSRSWESFVRFGP